MTKITVPIEKREEPADRTMACWLDISDAEFDFEAGQHASFTLLDPPHTDDRGSTRTFSMASSPHHRDRLLITTREGESAFKRSLNQVPEGTVLEVEGPYGSMTLHDDTDRPAVFIAGGIGITPFRSMIEWSLHEKTGHDIYFFYSNPTLGATAFWDDLRTWDEENEEFTLVPTLTDEVPEDWNGETGLIDADMVRNHLPDGALDSAVFYIAGPPGMVPAMENMLLDDLGVDDLRIKAESFAGY